MYCCFSQQYLVKVSRLVQIVRQLQTLGDMLKPVKQGAGAASEPPSTPAAAADGLQSRASGEGADGTPARNPKGFGGGFGSGKARRMSAASGRNRQTVGASSVNLLPFVCPYVCRLSSCAKSHHS